MTDHTIPVCIFIEKGKIIRTIWKCNLCITDKIPLKSSLTYSDKFETGHDEEFVLEVVNIGELEKIV